MKCEVEGCGEPASNGTLGREKAIESMVDVIESATKEEP